MTNKVIKMGFLECQDGRHEDEVWFNVIMNGTMADPDHMENNDYYTQFSGVTKDFFGGAPHDQREYLLQNNLSYTYKKYGINGKCKDIVIDDLLAKLQGTPSW